MALSESDSINIKHTDWLVSIWRASKIVGIAISILFWHFVSGDGDVL